MSKIWIGIDNGVSGSIGWSSSTSEVGQIATPTKRALNYQKRVSYINRVDTDTLKMQLGDLTYPYENSLVLLERPMVNPGRFKATQSALRSLEATLIVIEELDLPLQYIDSKEWQSKMLPKGKKGSKELKKLSLEVGRRLFPSSLQEKHWKDADGILIAEWGKRSNL